MKQILFYLTIIGFVSLQSCGKSEKEKRQAEYNRQKYLNELKFYYPKAYDDDYFTYKPKLIGAEGWITDDCTDSNNSEEKVIVKNESLIHEGHGSYKGRLLVEKIDNKQSVSIDFKCFKPDFSVGEWLSTKY